MKKTVLLAGVAAATLALASCGGEEKPTEEGKTIELTYSGTGSDKALNESLFEEWKAERKAAGDKNTYVIEYTDHGPDKVDSEIVDFSDDNAPDVFEFASDKIANLYNKGALSEITGKYADFIDTELNPLGQKTATFNGSYYGYTFTGDNTYYFQYDKSVFTDEDVKTMEGILAKAKASNKKVGYDLGTAFMSAGLLFTFGADYDVQFDEDGNVSQIVADFDGVKGQKAIKAMQQIMANDAWSKTVEVPSAKNGLAGCIAGTWDINNYKDGLGENYGCAPLPTITVDGETKHIGCFVGGKLLGVNPQRSVDNADRFIAAHELAMFLAGERAQTVRFTESNVGPCHSKVFESEAVKANANMQVLAQQAQWGHSQGAVPGGIWTAPNTLFNSVKDLGAKLDVAAAAKALNDGIKAVN